MGVNLGARAGRADHHWGRPKDELASVALRQDVEGKDHSHGKVGFVCALDLSQHGRKMRLAVDKNSFGGL